jgi:hypothetical protein
MGKLVKLPIESRSRYFAFLAASRHEGIGLAR